MFYQGKALVWPVYIYAYEKDLPFGIAMKVLLKEGWSIQQHLQKRKRERTRKDSYLQN